jgi:transcriptional regulator with GAF, ATPase, and Fis domain
MSFALVKETIERLNITRPKRGPQGAEMENQRKEVMRVLRETNGRVGGADRPASRMGINRTALISRIKRLGIRADELT